MKVKSTDGIGREINPYKIGEHATMGDKSFIPYDHFEKTAPILPCVDPNGNKANDGTHDCEIIKQYYYHYKWLTADKNDIISGHDTRQAYQTIEPMPKKENGKGETAIPDFFNERPKSEDARDVIFAWNTAEAKYYSYLKELKQQPGKIDKAKVIEGVYPLRTLVTF